MGDSTRNDVRALLKAFGIQADEAIMAHLEHAAGSQPLRLRVTLEDLTDYGDKLPDEKLQIEIDGEIRR